MTLSWALHAFIKNVGFSTVTLAAPQRSGTESFFYFSNDGVKNAESNFADVFQSQRFIKATAALAPAGLSTTA